MYGKGGRTSVWKKNVANALNTNLDMSSRDEHSAYCRSQYYIVDQILASVCLQDYNRIYDEDSVSFMGSLLWLKKKYIARGRTIVNYLNELELFTLVFKTAPL